MEQNMRLKIDLPLMLGLLGVCVASIVLAVISHGRTYFTFGTETDYLARNIAEAIRLLEKMPLLVQFHPPFYSMVLAGVKCFLSDWFTIGLLVSWLSGTAVLLITFLFFYRVSGLFAAWGSLVVLMLSRLFVIQSCLATQDMFFLALYSLCFYLALQATLRKSMLLWSVTGFVLGCALITRSNSITLLILVLAPFFTREDIRKKIRNAVFCLLACVLVIGSWVIVAKQTGSPVSPTHGHVNLAMRYFPAEGDPFSVKARQELVSKFGNYMDVITHDPVHVAREYIKDAGVMLQRNLFTSELMPFPWVLVALVGVGGLFFTWHSPFAMLFLLSTLAQIGLVNFKSYEPRFFLFLVPVLGAGLGAFIEIIFKYVKRAWHRPVVWALLFILLLPNVRWTYKRALFYLHRQDQELGEASGSIRNITEKSGRYVIVGLKPHIPYYTGVRVFVDDGYAKMPGFTTLSDLRQYLLSLTGRGTVYVYFGSFERKERPGIASLSETQRAPSWLEPVISGGAGQGWVFYRFEPEGKR